MINFKYTNGISFENYDIQGEEGNKFLVFFPINFTYAFQEVILKASFNDNNFR